MDRDLAKAKGNTRNKPCPCGSGKKFKKCHMTDYKTFMKYNNSKRLTPPSQEEEND